jgi:hypothetical protein
LSKRGLRFGTPRSATLTDILPRKLCSALTVIDRKDRALISSLWPKFHTPTCPKLTDFLYLGPVKPLAPLFIFLFLAKLAFAQVSTDSLQQKLDQVQLPQMPDSLKTSWHKVDSIRTDFNNRADSLKNKYQQAVGSVDAQTSKFQHKVDSLNNLKLPSNKYIHKLDSLNDERKKVEGDFNAKVDKLKSKTIGKLDKIEMTPEMQGPVGEFTSKVNGFSVTNNDFIKIPALEVPGYSIPKIDGMGDLSSSLSKASGLGDLPKIETPLGDVGDITKQAQGLSSDVKNISQGNLNEVKEIPKTAEAQLGKVDGIQELQKQSGIADGYKEQITNLNNPDAVKKQGADMVRKEAINHFAGKEEQLKAAMEKMSKYKQKYSSVSSIKDLPKRLPNAMKGKPFIERFIPGVYLQFQVKGAWLLDVNPYGSYKISGRFISGLGWNQRFVYDRKSQVNISRSRIYGPRAFLDFKLGKGFIAHLEEEAMNVFVPPTINGNPEQGKREWVWSTMLGMKKQYKIYKNLSGTVLIQYNLHNPYYKAPYLDRLNSRMGFEYVLHKKRKASEKN